MDRAVCDFFFLIFFPYIKNGDSALYGAGPFDKLSTVLIDKMQSFDF